MLVVTVAGAVAGAFATALATGTVEEILADDPPPSCPGDDCDGRNPEVQGCGDHAATFTPRTRNPAALEVRYSKRCKSVWGRITNGEPGAQVTVSVTGGSRDVAEIAYGKDKFTRMASVSDPASFEVEVCAVPAPREQRKAAWDEYCIHATEDSAWL
ncbi:DUF2690 domain-containing protein [Streptomyces sp. JJ36]|uniref:DUF2690 domain-containing protein n=1 Tax=Streptomyces sp. JJ36 TaxID=2736645 RepID=UPI001F28FA30|nr:DUF2690 domain-containing protein [Streptomyces sp. JJ36]